MSVVSNTGPIIALAKADLLSLLTTLYGDVFVPFSVRDELLARSSSESQRILSALSEFIQLSAVGPLGPEAFAALSTVDAGERDAIALAYELRTSVLLDDRSGRTAARRLGVAVFGTAGLLIEAKAAGLISAVRPVLEQIRDNGYWLSDTLIVEAARRAGEL